MNVDILVTADGRYYPEWVVKHLVELVEEYRREAFELAGHLGA